MAELRGWLLDLYADASADEADGLVLWLLAEDGRRLRLTQPFPIHLLRPRAVPPAARTVALFAAAAGWRPAGADGARGFVCRAAGRAGGDGSQSGPTAPFVPPGHPMFPRPDLLRRRHPAGAALCGRF
jgi:hypothetical protein